MTSATRHADPVSRRAAELLPWYVNGTLAEQEKADVERHLRECLTCRAALRDEQRMQALTRIQDDVPLSPQHGMLDLLRRIERKSARSRTSQWGMRLGFAAAAAFCIVAGWILLSPPGSAPEPFSTLSDSEASAVAMIDIVFADSITEREIREIVREIDGQLVAGPTELGRYTVSLAADSDSAAAAAIERLSGDPRIRFVGRNYIPAPAAEEE